MSDDSFGYDYDDNDGYGDDGDDGDIEIENTFYEAEGTTTKIYPHQRNLIILANRNYWYLSVALHANTNIL